MNTKEHEQYRKEFKSYAKKIISTRENAQNFLIRAGINTPDGELTKEYTCKRK
jgi:hypothetical protein